MYVHKHVGCWGYSSSIAAGAACAAGGRLRALAHVHGSRGRHSGNARKWAGAWDLDLGQKYVPLGAGVRCCDESRAAGWIGGLSARARPGIRIRDRTPTGTGTPIGQRNPSRGRSCSCSHSPAELLNAAARGRVDGPQFQTAEHPAVAQTRRRSGLQRARPMALVCTAAVAVHVDRGARYIRFGRCSPSSNCAR